MKAPHGQTGFARDVYRSFSERRLIFFPNWAVTRSMRDSLASAGSDIALVLSPEGAAFSTSPIVTSPTRPGGSTIGSGAEWADTVVPFLWWFFNGVRKPRERSRELLRATRTRPNFTRSRQINHGRQGTQDLPIGYRVVSFPRLREPARPRHQTCAISPRCSSVWCARRSKWKRTIARVNIRDVESRYRILFHLAYEDRCSSSIRKTLKILDANEGAARFLSRPVKKIAGSSVAIAFARQDQALALETLTEISRKRREETFKIRAVMLEEPVSVRVTPFREFGKTNLLVCFLADSRVGAGLSTVSSLLAIARNLPDRNGCRRR